MRDVYLILLSYSYSVAANYLLLQMQGSPTCGLKTEVILQFLQAALGCQLLFRNSWVHVMSVSAVEWPELGCRHIWGGTMCKDQPVGRVLALEAAESDYMLPE